MNPTRIRFSRGMTILELMVVSSILVCVFTVTFSVLAQLTRAATGSAAGAAEIALAAKMSEAFRNDVRQAKSVECSANGDRVTLKYAGQTIDYLTNADGRIERRNGGQLDFIGPWVFESKFAFHDKTETTGAIVLATWTCRADATVQQAGRVLILDTSLRTEGAR